MTAFFFGRLNIDMHLAKWIDYFFLRKGCLKYTSNLLIVAIQLFVQRAGFCNYIKYQQEDQGGCEDAGFDPVFFLCFTKIFLAAN